MSHRHGLDAGRRSHGADSVGGPETLRESVAETSAPVGAVIRGGDWDAPVSAAAPGVGLALARSQQHHQDRQPD